MCLNPVTIPNPSKYVSLRHRDQFLLQVPCGHCAECQSTMSNQWFYRSWYEFEECLSQGGFILFDTLTYSNKYLPHMSDYMQVDNDFPCFNRQHLHKFLDALDKRLKRKYHTKFRYFLSSEYGTNPRDGITCRPHYHILLYVYGDISPLVLSALVAEYWKYGRTDGVPYKPSYYVLTHNTITKDNTLGSHLRTCNYVSKYVQKSCLFDKEINKRINRTIFQIAENEYDNMQDKQTWLESEDCRRLRLCLKRTCNCFHLQSQHFGEMALQDIDLNQLFKDGCLYMPSFKAVKIPVPLSTYYKRKLFYELVEVDGCRYWQLTDLGKQYKDHRKSTLIDNLSARFKSLQLTGNLPELDTNRLAEYVYNTRGRIAGYLPESTLEQRLEQIDLFAYLTCTDKAMFGKRGFANYYNGSAQSGYYEPIMHVAMSIPAFIAKYVQLDEDREKELSMLYRVSTECNKGKQQSYELKQQLNNLYKALVSS